MNLQKLFQLLYFFFKFRCIFFFLLNKNQHNKEQAKDIFSVFLILGILCQVVQRKNIHGNRIKKFIVFFPNFRTNFYNRRSHSRNQFRRILVVDQRIKRQLLRQLFLNHLGKFKKIIAQHANIQVIVPGNALSVSNSPQ